MMPMTKPRIVAKIIPSARNDQRIEKADNDGPEIAELLVYSIGLWMISKPGFARNPKLSDVLAELRQIGGSIVDNLVAKNPYYEQQQKDNLRDARANFWIVIKRSTLRACFHRWTCGHPITPSPTTLWQLSRFTYLVVRKTEEARNCSGFLLSCSADRRRVLQAAFVPQRVFAARDLQRRRFRRCCARKSRRNCPRASRFARPNRW